MIGLLCCSQQVRSSEERMAQLRAELLLREENYNKHFRNGGVGEKVLSVGQAMNAQVSSCSFQYMYKCFARFDLRVAWCSLCL